MEPGKEDADVKTAPAPEAPARLAPGAVPSAEPLHGPVDAAEDSLDGPVRRRGGRGHSACKEEEK